MSNLVFEVSTNGSGHRATTKKRELSKDGAVAPVHHLVPPLL
ncbi:hypothetical protein [Novipirellula rosea]